MIPCYGGACGDGLYLHAPKGDQSVYWPVTIVVGDLEEPHVGPLPGTLEEAWRYAHTRLCI